MDKDQRFNEPGEEGLEGEYLGKKKVVSDPAQMARELVEDITHYIEENPKKTAVIAAVTLTAAVTAAVVVAAVTAVVIGASGLFRSRRKGHR